MAKILTSSAATKTAAPQSLPILYSFRRCPFAMRARLAIASAGLTVELREITLRNKPSEMLAASPKGTVPVLVGQGSEGVIDESLDIMQWALSRADPEGLTNAMTEQAHALITQCDGPFKTALDRTKYAVRYPERDPARSRAEAAQFVAQLDAQLAGGPWLFGQRPSMADLAILPFVRQFAHVDLAWWDAQPWPFAQTWLAAFKSSPRFAAIMQKYPAWISRQNGVLFGGN